MNYELKELNLKMGKLEYDMYQDIPSKESGSTNLCKGLPYEVFTNFLENEMAKKYQENSYYSTKTIIYIMYVDDYPVGYVGLRTNIDENWKKWCGNVYYTIRLSERSKGYGTKILSLAIQELKNLGLKEVYVKSSSGNEASRKVIENNGGIFIEEDNGSRHYKIII